LLQTGYQQPHKTEPPKNHRIILIGDLLNLKTLIAECFGTISFLKSNENSQILMVLVDGLRTGKHKDGSGDHSTFKDSGAAHLVLREISKRVSNQIGISTLYAMNFEFSAASQQNVNLLRSLLDPLKPSMAIIPFLKCKTADQKILAKSSLIACRDVRNLLMYNPDSSVSFHPQLISNLAPKDAAAKHGCLKMVVDSNRQRLASFQVSSSVNSARAPTLLEGGGSDLNLLKEAAELLPRNMSHHSGVAAKTIEGFAIHRLVFLS
jgi:hypothetical protein